MMTPEDFVALSLAEAPATDNGGFGYSMRLSSGNPNPPQCIALTWIAGKDESERDRIRAHSKKNVADFMEEPGFISIVTGFIGLRGFTVTAWESEAALRSALAKHHATAMRELFRRGFCSERMDLGLGPDATESDLGTVHRMWLPRRRQRRSPSLQSVLGRAAFTTGVLVDPMSDPVILMTYVAMPRLTRLARWVYPGSPTK